MLNVLRRPEIERRFGKRRSTMYAEQAAGLFPPPIALGARSVGWLEAEVVTLVAARAAGLSDDQLRSLLGTLVARRTNGTGGISVETGSELVREMFRSTSRQRGQS